jgi:hypothetical protein
MHMQSANQNQQQHSWMLSNALCTLP